MKKIEKDLKIAVVGLGYVGLPLAVEFSKKYATTGFDLDLERINELKKSIDKTLEITEEELRACKLVYTSDQKEISSCNVYIITVPTPVDSFDEPDMNALAIASKMVGKVLEKSNIVIYESTVYPGATEEYCVPILEKESGLTYNQDFFCGYSPERINPGDKDHKLKTITKVTSGSNENVADFVDFLYGSIVPEGTFRVSSIAVAEAAKVIENIQRDVNIALINELSMIFNKLGIDTNDVLEAAGTKWNFIPFKPGLVGGHCIGVDPYYLTYKAREVGYHAEMILAGRKINNSMGNYIAECTIDQMIKKGIKPDGANVAILGLTFKENCPDLRNTKVKDTVERLQSFNCKVSNFDPVADKMDVRKYLNIDLCDSKELSNFDAIVLTVSHDQYKSLSKTDIECILNKNGVLMDVKSIFPKGFFSDTNINHWRL